LATRLAAFLDRTKLFGAPRQAHGPVGHSIGDPPNSMRDSPPARAPANASRIRRAVGLGLARRRHPVDGDGVLGGDRALGL
jgi:hypothetical protein